MFYQGKIIAILPERSGTSANGNTWRIVTYILQYADGQYPANIKFQVSGDRIAQFNLQLNERVEVNIFPESSQRTTQNGEQFWDEHNRCINVNRDPSKFHTVPQQIPVQQYAPQPYAQPAPQQYAQQAPQYAQPAPQYAPQQAPFSYPQDGNPPY